MKLGLNEIEKEIFNQIFLASDDYKIVIKVLNQLVKIQETDMVSRHCDASLTSQNQLLYDKLLLQGANKLVKNLLDTRGLFLKKKDQ